MRKLVVSCIISILCILLISCESSESTEPYKNPITLDNEWEGYGLGDPYVFKHNGTYYLYVSTRDREVGVKVWSSENLVDWMYEGFATEEPETIGAYAPEVIYWNGYFYMYTSPAGEGHYVLKSESPTGPFEVITENIGRSIDGNVFVDDDGQLYFSYAGSTGINVAPMKDPVTIGDAVTTGAYMNGWTEGSTIFKRNGKYYMTYTGNHVFSNAYRVDYAVSDQPMSGYKPSEANPLLINAEGPTVGLGHNSFVKGPDLDTDYIFYHNLEGPGVIGPLRHMNMDRIAWNGELMTVLGPTYSEQQAPELADFEDRFNRKRLGSNWKKINGGKWSIHEQEFLRQSHLTVEEDYILVTKEETAERYTAEFHTQMNEFAEDAANPLYGAIFSYKDENNYGMALFNSKNKTLDIGFKMGGNDSEWTSAELPDDFDFTKLHQIRIEYQLGTFQIYVDGMHKATVTSELKGGSIGYFTRGVQADFGYTAFSNEANGSGVWDVYKPVPGTIQAVHYLDGEGEGYSVQQTDMDVVYREDPVVIEETPLGGYQVHLKNPQDWLQYNINVAEEGTYHLDLRLVTDSNQSKLRLMHGEKELTDEVELPNTNGSEKTITIQNLPLEKGNQKFRIELLQGELSLSSFTFYEAHEVELLETDFSDGIGLEWNMFESFWSAKKGTISASEGEFSKVLVGETGWTDYSVQADVQLKKENNQAGIIVRGLHPANGLERGQNNPDFNQGYFAYLQSDGLYLVKQNFGREILQHVPLTIQTDSWQQLKVMVEGTKIQVFINESETPAISYEDTSLQPFTHGRTGLLTVNGHAEFDNFIVTKE